MFIAEFKEVTSQLQCDFQYVNQLCGEIHRFYSEAHRHYHNLKDLDHIVQELTPIQDHISNWPAVMAAVAWHDVVYDPLRHDNEERSCDFAMQRMEMMKLKNELKNEVKEMIMASKRHEISENADVNFFCDADLAILGANSESYVNYSHQIRKEFSMYDDVAYNSGRISVLENLLSMKTIYKTDFFQKKFENRARKNMNDELKVLSA